MLIAEWGRQFNAPYTPEVGGKTVERAVYRFQIRLDHVIDLRDPRMASNFGVTDVTTQFRQRDVAQSTAAFIRSTTDTQGLVVPSIAFTDDLTRWNLVVFLDKAPADTRSWVQHVAYVGPLRWR